MQCINVDILRETISIPIKMTEKGSVNYERNIQLVVDSGIVQHLIPLLSHENSLIRKSVQEVFEVVDERLK